MLLPQRFHQLRWKRASTYAHKHFTKRLRTRVIHQFLFIDLNTQRFHIWDIGIWFNSILTPHFHHHPSRLVLKNKGYHLKIDEKALSLASSEEFFIGKPFWTISRHDQSLSLFRKNRVQSFLMNVHMARTQDLNALHLWAVTNYLQVYGLEPYILEPFDVDCWGQTPKHHDALMPCILNGVMNSAELLIDMMFHANSGIDLVEKLNLFIVI